ncbi:ANKRD50 [Symbiodinium necroappetens]|uniref:ANKRD50 protein n=1 Tax=Symbiodinium necroappetens TaxID=1628268 RepID=A0A812T312_9DINO|nr:ANKRD50 [Symbiodinium necroappetens]
MGSWGEMFQTAAAAADSIEEFEEQYGSAPPILIGSDYHSGYPGKKGRGKGRKGGKAKAQWQARSFQNEPKQDQEEAATQSEVLATELAMLRKRVARMEAALEAAGIEIPGSDMSEAEGSQELSEEEEPSMSSDAKEQPPLQAGDTFADACFQAAMEHDRSSRRQR